MPGLKAFLSRGGWTIKDAMTPSRHNGPFVKAPEGRLFTKVDPKIDGDECDHDCASCTIRYPPKFKIDEDEPLYGHVKAWETHLLVATGKSDWVRDVEDESGSVMEAVGKADKPSNGRLMLSASNIPTPSHTTDYKEPTSCLLLPAFTIVENVTPGNVPDLITSIVNHAPTSMSPLPESVAQVKSLNGLRLESGITTRSCPHDAVILLCSQRTRDARCGQSAPLLKKEFERHLRPLGLYRDFEDERKGGVGIYFISHVGGHKFSANVMVYRRAGFGQKTTDSGDDSVVADLGASQCIWLARVRPEDCEGIIKFTVMQGKVVKPERQLRGGFDREKGLCSW